MPRRILLVEDEFMIAMHMCAVIKDAGHEVVGPAGSIGQAMRLLADGDVDGAILDMNLAGVPIVPLTEVLDERGIPYFLVTGYDDTVVPDRLRGPRRLQKPVNEDALHQLIRQVFEGAAEPGRRAAGR